MRRKIIAVVPVTLGLTVALAGLTVSASDAWAAEDCIAKPTTQAPQGSHWFYHTDQASNQKCWFLKTDDGRVLLGAQDDGEETAAEPEASDAQPSAANAPTELAPPRVRSERSESAQHPTPPARSSHATVQSAPRPRTTGQDNTATVQTAQAPAAPATASRNSPAWPSPTRAAPTAVQPATATQTPSAPPVQTIAADEGPKPVVPIRVEVAQPAATPQATSPQAPQTVAMQDQRQVQPKVGSDQTVQQTEGSAIAMLQKAYQRMTAPPVPGSEPDHTLALVIAGLAFVTIGIGVVVAARWSLHGEKQRQQPAWVSKERTASHQTIGRQDARYQVYRVADVRSVDLRSVEAQRLDDQVFEEQQQPLQVQNLDEPRVDEPRFDEQRVAMHRDRPQPEDFFAAVTAKPNAKAAHAYQQREPLHEYVSEPSISTNSVQSNLRELLRELDTKLENLTAPETPVEEFPRAARNEPAWLKRTGARSAGASMSGARAIQGRIKLA